MKRIHIHYRHWLFRLPMLRYYRGICLGRGIYFKESQSAITDRLLRHEMAHQEQITRDGLIRFYFTYLRDYARNLVRYRNHSQAYLNIPYEAEARSKEELS